MSHIKFKVIQKYYIKQGSVDIKSNFNETLAEKLTGASSFSKGKVHCYYRWVVLTLSCNLFKGKKGPYTKSNGLMGIQIGRWPVACLRSRNELPNLIYGANKVNKLTNLVQ